MAYEYEVSRDPAVARAIAYSTAISPIGTESSITRQEIQDVELKDLPPPIFWDDEFGKASLCFGGLRGVNLMKPLAILYTEFDQTRKPITLLLNNLLNGGWYFVRNPRQRFSCLSDEGEKAVFFSWEHLQTRQFLFALLHEIRHTHQAHFVGDLLRIVRSDKPKATAEALLGNYPRYAQYISDLYHIVGYAYTTGKQREAFAKKIRHTGPNGVNPRGLTPQLRDNFEVFLQNFGGYQNPLGPVHPAGIFFVNPFYAEFPALFHVIDPLVERFAWETAAPLDKSYTGELSPIHESERGVVQCGFYSLAERKLFMGYGLGTYNNHYRTNNYTQWLTDFT